MLTSINGFLEEMVQKDASDAFFNVGSSPSIRIHNKIVQYEHPELTDDDMFKFMDELLNNEQKEELASALDLNIACTTTLDQRFRISFFYQQYHIGFVVRHIKSHIPDADEIGLPESYKKSILDKRGLVLLVGATGAGKSTSIASMLKYRNQNLGGHIITIEDPLEFIHTPEKCIFTQREVGIDTFSYDIALKNAMRQSPDVLVIGEIRDRETLENAILFCETGHLVVSSLHASSSNQAIERMLNFFNEEKHGQISKTLSQNINAIFSQRLVEGVNGNNRVLAHEALINEGLVKVQIEENKIKELKETMKKNADHGMMTFDQCLVDLFKNGKISEEVAIKEADNPSNLKLSIATSDGGGKDFANIVLPSSHFNKNEAESDF